MADAVGNVEASQFGLGVPVEKKAFYLKGTDHTDWGIKDRLARIFDKKSGNTVMLAFDHGYLMGPTSGLERLDLSIVPLVEYADCLMGCRGSIRSVIPPDSNKPLALRASSGTTILTELNDECIIDVDDAVRLNASAMAVMVSVGGDRSSALGLDNFCWPDPVQSSKT
ncbi:MAG: 3-hydroxy-5-phosphonooxypentane-2,4-dione thiolase LsrF, partial [Planctomycetes bacterium]|nr:3-hydroxy-5-phosphonooxypentane-2,4-dione thiolase LsrF [Planctomycetota bacterium]